MTEKLTIRDLGAVGDHLPDCRLVGEIDGEVIAFAVLSPVSPRHVYRGIAEVSIYLKSGVSGVGHGTRLLNALIEASEVAGMWTLQAMIFPENETSLALHRRCGFRMLGIRRRLGKMSHGPLAGTWRDVALLERRSDKVA